MNDQLISIGKILGPYGIKGWVKVSLLTDFPERIKALKEVALNGPAVQQVMEIEGARPYRDGYLIKFKTIDSPEAAQILIRALLQIELQDIHPLPDGVYYHFQLEGLAVYDEKLGHLGELKEVLETGANDVYVVESICCGEILIPALKQTIIKVDLEAGRMEVALPPGLVD